MLLSVVIPVRDEEEALPLLLAALRPVLATLGCEHELLFVDDGSRDGSRRLLMEAASADPRVKVLGFSRNFGHQAAITAGLDFASGDAVVAMDADLQDPPELIPEMVALYRRGLTSSRRSGSSARGRAPSRGARPRALLRPDAAGGRRAAEAPGGATSGSSAGRPSLAFGGSASSTGSSAA